MTAGYFSAIKKVKCRYKEPTTRRLVRRQDLAAFRDPARARASGRCSSRTSKPTFPARHFFPRPKAYLAACDGPTNRWALVMEDADTFAEHKVHEHEMNLDDVQRWSRGWLTWPSAWEGCDRGDKAEQLAELGVDLWASDANLAIYKAVMPGGAKLFDKFTTSRLQRGRRADLGRYLGAGHRRDVHEPDRRLLSADALPENGATCTLSHGDHERRQHLLL